MSRGLLWLARSLKESPDDASAADQRQTIRMWIGVWLCQLHTLNGLMEHPSEVSAVAFSPDGKTVLTGSRKSTAQLWEASTGKPLGASWQHERSVVAVAFSPDGKTVLTGSSDETARLWEASTGKPLGAPLRHQGGSPPWPSAPTARPS